MSIHARFRLDYPGFTLDADLELPGRGVTALFGHSGSGKTTLLRCIAGLERGAGRLEVNGEVWQDADRFEPTHRRALGYVFQDARLFAHLDVQRNLDFGQRRSGGARRDRAAIVELLGLAPLLDRLPERLAALDLARKLEILPYLERLRDELDIPMIYVSHAPDEVARLADHIVVMEAGRAVAHGPLAATLARVDLPLRLGEDAGVVFAATVVERDAAWHLAKVGFDGGELWVRDNGAAVGKTVRLRILARDVSIAHSRHDDVSIINLLPATVGAFAGEDHPALLLLQLQLGGTALLARLTRRSAHALALAPGCRVWVQIKAVALIG